MVKVFSERPPYSLPAEHLRSEADDHGREPEDEEGREKECGERDTDEDPCAFGGCGRIRGGLLAEVGHDAVAPVGDS